MLDLPEELFAKMMASRNGQLGEALVKSPSAAGSARAKLAELLEGSRRES
jgi:hypothetical protein